MIEFNNMMEFSQAITSAGKLSTFNQHLTNFMNTTGGLFGGCGCNRAHRAETARRLYVGMAQALSDAEKAEIKLKLNVDKIQLADNGAVFAIF